MMHPQDAEARGIVNEQMVRVTSRVGAVEIAAEITDEIMPGVISIPMAGATTDKALAGKLRSNMRVSA